MQIAQVVPKVKTRGAGIFDYAIPPQLLPMIKIGLLVEVPFRGRKIEGIIVDIKKSSQIQNLKPIISVVDPEPVVDLIHTELAKWMSTYYITDFAKTLFENVVPPAIRTIKKLEANKSTDVLTPKKQSPRQYLIMGDFTDRLKFYEKIINKNLSFKKQIIILVPDIILAQKFLFFDAKNTMTLHSNLTKTERWTVWNKIRRNEAKIIIGSNSALFSPVKNLGLIIVEHEESETYKNDQSPRFNVTTVAEKLAKISGADLIISSTAPSIASIYKAKEKKIFYKIKEKNEPEISIVNMNFEKSFLSLTLQDAINTNLENKQKTILLVNRRGEGSKTTCLDCNWVLNCPNCTLPLTPFEKTAHCANCEKILPLPSQCPNCHGLNLKNMGLTTSKVEKRISQLWPGTKVIRIEKDHEADLNSNWDIAVATTYIQKFDIPQVSLATIVDADQNQNIVGFRSSEKSFQSFYQFLKSGSKGIIQTHLPESNFIKNLAQLNYEGFYQTEIYNRQKFFYPPFKNLVKIIFRDSSEDLCVNETKKIYAAIKKIIDKSTNDYQIMGPTPMKNIQKRGLFLYQIILKFSRRLPELDLYLKSLGRGWIIDVDPFDIS